MHMSVLCWPACRCWLLLSQGRDQSMGCASAQDAGNDESSAAGRNSAKKASCKRASALADQTADC
ncbi:hypothetical protein PILCRDRAFT_817938 [Piloderma croceum F 1598]|uniref:Secreted protein n=1 Tax=Piloderma croceum (strain F 1598) TaxID=765440 RepID=A0A0C3FZE3_PILCF|nr:hypothetical protein PILCRDRAFT_817938 [Piloderma croceum F 1598]